jgi:hypothetical protein
MAMPRDPEEGTIDVNEGEAPEAGEASGEESFGFDEIPESVFDKKQAELGKRRKPAGPPLTDDAEMFGIEGPEEPDVPPTFPEEAPESEGV